MSSSPKPLSRAVILIGFMGSGKSSIGRAVARRLNTPFVDLDARIELEAGASIPQVFATHGEEWFRELETRVLEEALNTPAIIATGGGVVTREGNRNLLQSASQQGSATVIYLRAQPETLAERIRRQPGARPLIDAQSTLDGPQTVIRVRELLAARAPFYEACADAVVETDRRPSEAVAQSVIEALKL